MFVLSEIDNTKIYVEDFYSSDFQSTGYPIGNAVDPEAEDDATAEILWIWHYYTEEEKVRNARCEKYDEIAGKIAGYKAKLASTDYIVVKMSELQVSDEVDALADCKVKYADKLAERIEAREKINILEKELEEYADVLEY